MTKIPSRLNRERPISASGFPLGALTTINLYRQENDSMNKPYSFALAMFVAMFGAALARSYFMHEDVDWIFELASSVGIAVYAYAFAQWKQQKTESKSESDDS
jgi:hypothetical protein